MRYTRMTGALATLLFAGACSNDSTGLASAEALLNADVATVAADAAAQDVEVMQGPGGAFGMGLLFHPTRFDCNREFPSGLTVERVCVFKDAAGAVQAAYDATTTASASVTTLIDGSFDRVHLSATLHRETAFVVTGLAGTETSRTWNGSGSGTFSRIHERSDGTERTYEASATAAITNVVIPVPRTLNSWPLSGTIHRVVTITRGNGTTVTRDVTVTFNGTATVTVLVNGESFEFDLSTRHRPNRRNR